MVSGQQAQDVTRRGLFTLGTAFVATLAALVTPKTVWAGNCGTACCDLWSCTQCQPNGGCSGGWVCPPGYQDSWWLCTSGGKHCTCGECTRTTNCDDGTWVSCSYGACY